MGSTRTRTIAAIALNALVVVLEIWAIGYSISKNGFPDNYVFYTQCSNLMGAIVCALCLIVEVRALAHGKGLEQVGRALRWAKFAATSCLLMTFLVVVAVLAPMLEYAGYPGYYLMFVDGSKSVTHFLGPLLVTVSCILFEADPEMTLCQSLVGFAPTLAYAAVAYPCNILRLWDGPYPFFQVYNMPIWMSVLWFVVLFVVAFGLCQVPRLAARRCARGRG